MKNTRDAFAGYVAEFWCASWLAKYYSNIFPHEFGGERDYRSKVDYFAVEMSGADFLLDAKGSITHPNLLIETDHPAFNLGNLFSGHRGFVLPFKDFPEILVVRSTIWFKNLLEEKAIKKTFNGREVYVVNRDCIIKSDYSSNDVIIIKTDESFEQFFTRNFPNNLNPIASMSDHQIKDYLNHKIKELCLTDDIPDI